jgi:hypothetical protein
MDVQLTLSDKEIQNAITYWLEHAKGIMGVTTISISGGGYGSTSSATVRVNENDMQSAINKKVKAAQETAKNASTEPKLKVAGNRLLDMN